MNKSSNPTVSNINSSAWEKCSMCKKDIFWGAKWYKCSVSTCNRVRFKLQFCSVECWDAHVPGQNHRSAHCTEQVAPKKP